MHLHFFEKWLQWTSELSNLLKNKHCEICALHTGCGMLLSLIQPTTQEFVKQNLFENKTGRLSFVLIFCNAATISRRPLKLLMEISFELLADSYKAAWTRTLCDV